MGNVMFGREHDQPGILIEPQHNHAIDINDAKQISELRNKLWFDCPQFLSNCDLPYHLRSAIDEANKTAPAFSRIFKEMILVTSKDKPLPRTGKGTVMRKMALKIYEGEIESLCVTYVFQAFEARQTNMK